MRTKLSKEEKKYFVKLVSKAREKISKPIADPSGVEMYWNDKYNEKNGILGSFNWMKPKEIDLSFMGKDSKEIMVSIVAHELHHKWQYKIYGSLYFLMSLPIIREYLLEKTANIVEKEVDVLMKNQNFT